MLDRASSCTLTCANLCAFKRGPSRTRSSKLLRSVSQNNFCVCADVDKQLHFFRTVWPFSQDRRSGVGADMSGDAWTDVITCIWQFQIKFICPTADRLACRQNKRCHTERRWVDTQNNVMHNRIANNRDFEYALYINISLRYETINHFIERSTNCIRQLNFTTRVHHHIRNATHQVFAKSNLRVHQSIACDDLATFKFAQVTSNSRRANVYRDAICGIYIARPCGHNLIAILQVTNRNSHFAFGFSHC